MVKSSPSRLINARAQSRALMRLMRKHYDEYREYYLEEKKKLRKEHDAAIRNL